MRNNPAWLKGWISYIFILDVDSSECDTFNKGYMFAAMKDADCLITVDIENEQSAE